MKKTIVIDKKVLNRFISEALGDSISIDCDPAPASVYEPLLSDTPVIAANDRIEDENVIVEPPVGDPDFLPVNNVSLAKSLYTIAKGVPADKVKKFYKDVKELFISLSASEEKMNISNIDEAKLRRELKKIIKEVWDEEDSGYSIIDPSADEFDSGDPADLAADEEETARELERQQARMRGKQLYKDIAAETGLSVSGAKGEAVRSTKRFIFLMNMADLAQDEYKKLIDTALDSYIGYLESSGALSDDEVTDLKNNPDLVKELEGFRDHMRKHVTRLAKQKGISLEWEKEFGTDAQAEFGAEVRRALGV